MQNIRPYKIIYLFLLWFTFSGHRSAAQNVSSPYSILGIGDVDTREYGRYFSEGGTSLSRRDETNYNGSNPAALSVMPTKLMNFDIATSGRINSFMLPGADTSAGSSKDFIIKRVTLAFKLSRATGIAFGFKPYSTVSYAFINNQSVLNGNTTLSKITDGSGGINQVYFSVGSKIGDVNNNKKNRFSVGATVSYLFGSLDQSTQYTVNNLPVNITQQNTNSYYGASFQGGIQYYTPAALTRKWRHLIGITATAYTSLIGQYITDYVDSNNLAVTPVPEGIINGQVFRMPYSAGIGYSAVHNNSLTFSVDFNYYGWPSQNVKYTNSFTTPVYKLSAGIEYSKKVHKNYLNSYYGFDPDASDSVEKYFVGLGASVQNSYILVNGNYLKDYAVSLGGGYNVSKNLSLFGGLEFGVRGDLNVQQIQETYTNIVFGMTLKNQWFGTKKIGRFP